MRAIVRKNRYRAQMGKASTFKIRRKTLDFTEVVRYWERKGIKIDDVVISRDTSKTPEMIECLTPLQSPLKTPEDLAAPERALVKVQDYIAGCFDAGIWKDCGQENECESTKPHGGTASDISSFSHQCRLVRRLFDQSRYREAFRVLGSCCVSIKQVLLKEDPQLLHVLIGDTLSLVQSGQHDIALVILRHISAMGEVLYGSCHPIKMICAELGSLDLADETFCAEILERYLQNVGDCFEDFLGPLHLNTIYSRLELIFANKSEKAARALLRRCEISVGKSDCRTLEIYLRLGYQLYRQRAFTHANEIFQDILTIAESGKVPYFSTYFKRESLRYLAFSSYRLGNTDAATGFICEHYQFHTSQEHSLVARLMLEMEGWLAELGDFESAAQVETRRIEYRSLWWWTMTECSVLAQISNNLPLCLLIYGFHRFLLRSTCNFNTSPTTSDCRIILLNSKIPATRKPQQKARLLTHAPSSAAFVLERPSFHSIIYSSTSHITFTILHAIYL